MSEFLAECVCRFSYFSKGTHQFTSQHITSKWNFAENDSSQLFNLGRWIQSNLDYIDEIGEINKLGLGTLMDKGGDCEDGTILFLDIARAKGHGDKVAAVLYEGHIAPLVKGKFGSVNYQINGEWWSLFELATSRGQMVGIGESNKIRKPIGFLFGMNNYVSAEGYVINEMGETSDIYPAMVRNFEMASTNLEGILNSIRIDDNITPDQIDHIQESLDPLNAQFMEAYKAIVGSGKISKEIMDRKDELVRRILRIDSQISELSAKREQALKLLDLSRHPERVQRAFEQFQKIRIRLIQDLETTGIAFENAYNQCSPRANSCRELLVCHNQLMGKLNQSNVISNYHAMGGTLDTLGLIPNAGSKIKQDVNRFGGVIDKLFIEPLNKLRGRMKQNRC